MATEIVTPKTALELNDAIDDKLNQASAIVDLLGSITGSDCPMHDATPCRSARAVRGLINDAKTMTSELFKIANRDREKIDRLKSTVDNAEARP